MDKNSVTYKMAISLIEQSADKCDNDFAWFITAIMRLISLENDMSLLDFFLILKEEIPRTNEIFNYYDQKLYEGSFSEFIEEKTLIGKE